MATRRLITLALAARWMLCLWRRCCCVLSSGRASRVYTARAGAVVLRVQICMNSFAVRAERAVGARLGRALLVRLYGRESEVR